VVEDEVAGVLVVVLAKKKTASAETVTEESSSIRKDARNTPMMYTRIVFLKIVTVLKFCRKMRSNIRANSRWVAAKTTRDKESATTRTLALLASTWMAMKIK